MANERNNTALEFETMLRRHLKSGGAPVAACAGFDFDAASAYLEDALGESHRAGYESHLAGCVTCRRHMIELARLAQTAPLAVTQPSKAADQTPAWVRWRGAVAGWFDLSSWKFKWQIAGVSGAAFATLIAALGAHAWWQASSQHELAARVNTAAPAPMSVSVPSPTPEPSLSGESLMAGAESEQFANQRARSTVPVPTPHVGPSPGEIAVPMAPSNESPKLNQNPQGGLSRFESPTPSTRRDTAGEAQQGNLPIQGRAFQQFSPIQMDGQGDARQSVPSTRAGAAPANQEAADSSGQFRIIPPGINPTHPGPSGSIRPQIVAQNSTPPPVESNVQKPEPESSAKTETEKSLLRKSLDEFKRRINPIPPLKPDVDREASRLAASVNSKSKTEATRARPVPKPADDESPKGVKTRIRDKVFVYRRDVNMWFDQDYREETMLFRRLTLRRGSKEYEDVLAKEPQLKEFFDHGPILVVWKNKIYRVK